MRAYQHQFNDQSPCPFTLGKIVCVGRNYAAHAHELNNPVPTQPLLFIKPATAAVAMAQPIRLPRDHLLHNNLLHNNLPHKQGEVHYETELAILIGERLTAASEDAVRQAIAGYGLALDLTLRDLQSELKKQGHPWELAKAFDGACPVTAFVPAQRVAHVPDAAHPLYFSLAVDGIIRQQGDTRQMLHALVPLIAYMSQHFTLLPGDLVLTGTPAGVGALQPGAVLSLQLTDETQQLLLAQETCVQAKRQTDD